MAGAAADLVDDDSQVLSTEAQVLEALTEGNGSKSRTVRQTCSAGSGSAFSAEGTSSAYASASSSGHPGVKAAGVPVLRTTASTGRRGLAGVAKNATGTRED